MLISVKSKGHNTHPAPENIKVHLPEIKNPQQKKSALGNEFIRPFHASFPASCHPLPS